jgi:hypothetical protein
LDQVGDTERTKVLVPRQSVETEQPHRREQRTEQQELERHESGPTTKVGLFAQQPDHVELRPTTAPWR